MGIVASALRIFVEDCRYPDRVTHATGYAEVQRQIILGLDAVGEQVGFPACADALARAAFLPVQQRERLEALARRPFTNDTGTIHLQVASPDGFLPRPGRLTVGLTMTERETLSGYQFDWAAACNRLDAVITPTEWNRDVFERNGIHNVHVVPLGIDTDYFAPRPVRFLSVFAGYGWPGSRANWEDLLRAYEDEFAGCDDVAWTIVSLEARAPLKFGGLRHALRAMPSDLRQLLRRAMGTHPTLKVIQAGRLTHEQMRDIYREHDCFVSYSREGWGLPLLEALACSLEVIACDYGAPLAFLAGSPARLFAAGRLRADNMRFVDGDVSTLRAHLRAVYEERRRARRWALRFAWAHAVERLRDVLRELQSRASGA